VPRQIVVAIWGLESDFGKGDIGKMPVIRTLAQAHDCRRTNCSMANCSPHCRSCARRSAVAAI